MSICRKREKKHVSIRAHIIILILLTTEVHSGEGSDSYPGLFKQKKRNGGQREPRAQEAAVGKRFRYTRQRAKRAGQAILFSPLGGFILDHRRIYFPERVHNRIKYVLC